MLKIYFDGGCRPNPGTMESAVVARGAVHHRCDLGHGTSEQAEWHALLHAMEVAQILGERDVILLGDSMGVIAQAKGEARCRWPNLLERFDREKQTFHRVRLRQVKRTQNLAGIALGHALQRRRMSSMTGQDSA